MIEYRKLCHEDYEDVVELCKDIWDGTDYLPELFHKWVEDEGLFLGAYDTETSRVVGTDKFSVLYDGTGWLEGLRVHKDYRGRKIAREMAEIVFAYAKAELSKKTIKKIACSTHISAAESIRMLKKTGFVVEQEYLLLHKLHTDLDKDLKPEDFTLEPWTPSYEEFVAMPSITRRANILPLAFYFEKPTQALYNDLVKKKCFVQINGHKGIFKLKTEPHFLCTEDTFEGVNTFFDYYSLTLDIAKKIPPMTGLFSKDEIMIERLKASGVSSWNNWENDYFYFVYNP